MNYIKNNLSFSTDGAAIPLLATSRLIHQSSFGHTYSDGTGGNISYAFQNGLTYKIHTFVQSGTFVPPTGLSSVEVLVVAGGGGGGYAYGGGGGAGGLIHNTAFSITGNQAVTVGAGSTTTGGNSVFGSLTAVGGGYGDANVNGTTGGSGGGGSGNLNAVPGSGTVNQGNAGGTGVAVNGGCGGGGGGAGAVGTNAYGDAGSTPANPGVGGSGKMISILGVPQWYAGGGGGGNNVYSTQGASGGLGGGGASNFRANGSAGTPNTGGGGGGGAQYPSSTYFNGAAGGSGIVIVRYPVVFDQDEVWLYMNNTHTESVLVVVEWNDSTSKIELLLPSKSGSVLVVPGLILRNGKIVSAYCGIDNKVFVSGYVNSICNGTWQGRTMAVYGYYSGGGGSAQAATDRIVFSTGITSANTVSNLVQARRAPCGVSDCVLYGYAAGDYYTITDFDRITFSTGIFSALNTSDLSLARGFFASLSDGVNYGYFSGGHSGGVSFCAVTDRIVFSNGTVAANTASNLSQERKDLTSLSDRSLYGYFSGGDTTVNVVTTDRVVFSSSVTSANTISNLSQARTQLYGISDNLLYGYFSGGYTGAAVTTTDRIVFSTGIASANTISNLPATSFAMQRISDGAIYGYISERSNETAYKITFSTGIFNTNSVSRLSTTNYSCSSIADFAV